MRALVQYGLRPGEVELRDVPLPEVTEDSVLLRVDAVGICGSDIHQVHGTQSWEVRVPVVLGHEFTGTIERVGPNVVGFRPGQRVVSETAAVICGRCTPCRTGHYNLCPHRQGFGYGIDGAMAEYVRVPARCLHAIPQDSDAVAMALTEPTCVAYQAVVQSARVRAGDSVLVLGPGQIGLLSAMLCKLQGAQPVVVLGTERDEHRLKKAEELGVDAALRVDQADLRELASGIGDGLGFHLVVDASGASASFVTAMEAVRPLGEIVKVGWGPQPLAASLDPLVRKAVTVRGSFSHTYETWEQVIRLIASGRLPTRQLVGFVGGLASWRTGFDLMGSGQVVKSVLLPNGEAS